MSTPSQAINTTATGATKAAPGPALDWWLAPVSGAPVVTEAGSGLLSATKRSSTNVDGNSTDEHAHKHGASAHCNDCATTTTTAAASSAAAPAAGGSISATAALGITATTSSSSNSTGAHTAAKGSKSRGPAKSLGLSAKLKAAVTADPTASATAAAAGGSGSGSGSGGTSGADDGSQSLAVVYHDAQRLHRSLESLSGDDKQKRLQTAFLGFLKVEKMVADSQLISPNEELDDVATADLKYVLVDFYLGDLLMGMGGAAQRLARVRKAVEYLKKFLTQCIALKCLPKDETATFKRYLSGARATPQVQREEKIAAHKRETAVTAKLDAMLKKRDELKRAGKLDDALAENDDEEREYTLTLVSQCQMLALRHLLMSGQELDILEHMARMAANSAAAATAKGGAPPSAIASGASAAGSGGGGGGSAQPKPKPEVYKITSAQQLGSLPPSMAQHINFRAADGSLHSVSELNAIQNAINRQSHSRELVFRDPNPPTMDLDTFVARERQNGGILPAQTAPEKSEEDVAAEEDEDEAANDKKTLKQRKWDDWADEHEKGAGNKMK